MLQAAKIQFPIADMNNESLVLGFGCKKTKSPLKIIKFMMSRYHEMISRLKKLTLHASRSQEMTVSNRGHKFLLK